ncbi:MAG: LapA family protein [Acidimicrobiales bacterium]
MADDTKRGGLHPAFIAGLILALALLDFVLQNTDDVRVHFLFLSTTKPLWLLLLLTSALAIGAAEVFALAWRRRRS